MMKRLKMFGICWVLLSVIFAGFGCLGNSSTESTPVTTTGTTGETTGETGTGGTQTQNNSILGDWGMNGKKVYTFTNTLWKMYLSDDGSSVNFGYTASNGKGYYWMSDSPSAKVPFSYSIYSNKMDLTIEGTGGGSFTLVRM